MNITPDSFSDGGYYLNSNNIDHFISSYKEQWDWLDIGAQSTAPNREGIGPDNEIQRWQQYAIPALEKLFQTHLQEFIRISVDTYHTEVMEFVSGQIDALQKRFSVSTVEVIFNDVSGDLSSALDFLKRHPHIGYVLTFNSTQNRSQTSNHINFIKDSQNITDDCINFFQNHQALIDQHQLDNTIIFDPGLGFAKSREQNQDLIRHMHNVITSFSRQTQWLIGISRKSFLRVPYVKELDESTLLTLEIIQAMVVQQFLGCTANEGYRFILRTHRPELFHALQTYKTLYQL